MSKNSPASCRRCIMDNVVDSAIMLNADGICHHCLRYDELLSARVVADSESEQQTSQLISTIKSAGKGKSYDCIIGVSGGVDSTYVAYLVKKFGLRALAVHLDNGWDSELAVANIENILKKLDIDLYTYVIDWNEFKDLQLSFLKASVPDGEIPTDHAISAVLWQVARKYNVKYIISGMNFRTESIAVPNWAYGHSDWCYIKNIHKRFGNKKLTTYPKFTFVDLFYINFIKRIKIVSLLNYVIYNKEQAKKVISEELGWVDYGGKHFESIYTRFYQGYYLPTKFGIDKRYGHLSDLINSKQISRQEAINQVKEPAYDSELMKQDISYVKQKFGLSSQQFDELLSLPVKSFNDYPNSYDKVQKLRKFVNQLRHIGLYPK